MRTPKISQRLTGWLVVAVLSFGLIQPKALPAAEAKPGAKKKTPVAAPIFYPPAPAEPRLQYLTSFSDDGDLGAAPNKFARFLVGKEAPKRSLFKPYGLALWDGKIFVSDTGRRGISILDLGLRKLYYLDSTIDKFLHTPINIRLDQDGTRYVADRGHNQILIFATDETLLGAIGEKSAGDAKWQTNAAATPGTLKPIWPTDVAISSDRLYVTDLNNNCVQVYTKTNRQPLFQIPRDRQDASAKLFAPANLALDSQNQLYVSDMGGFFVKKYNAEGKFLRAYGRSGDRPGEFARPKGVAVDREGRLYVVDAAAQVIQIFNPEGQVLMFFGESGGSAVPLDLPTQVIIDYDHLAYFQKYAAPNFKLEYLVLAVNQYGSRKVSVYGFGQSQ
jgi:DNA-binding beta-propeller fold protein YncE